MIQKRRDSKNRVLRTGESQRTDGRYTFKYLDNNGKQCFLYSWRLEPTDKLPNGKRECIALRDQVRKLNYDMAHGIVPNAGNITILHLVEKYISQKTGVRHNTRAGYETVINLLKNDPFGARRIDSIRPSDAKSWLIKLQREDGKSYSSIHSIRGVLRPAFQMAYADQHLPRNPFDFPLSDAIVNDSARREALSKKDQQRFLDFIKQDKHFCKYYDAIYILLNTGLRISEFVGLTIHDIDLINKTINVDHQLQRTRKMEYLIVDTKTESGKRILPMEDDVCECFKRIIAQRPKPKTEPMIQGKVGFLFLDKNNMPMVALHWEHYFQHIIGKYNKIYKTPLPKVTPHICRHTYCTNKAKQGMNPKQLQYFMGHSDIAVTLNVYTHVDLESARKELERLAN